MKRLCTHGTGLAARMLMVALVVAMGIVGLSTVATAQHYYDPDMSGHGISLHYSDAGDAVAIWYTHSPAGDPAWFISDAHELGQTVDLYAPSALFPARWFDLGDPVGYLTVTPTEQGVTVDYGLQLWQPECERVLPGPHPPYCQGSSQMVLLAH